MFIRRAKAPIALITQAALLFGSVPIRMAHADEGGRAPAPVADAIGPREGEDHEVHAPKRPTGAADDAVPKADALLPEEPSDNASVSANQRWEGTDPKVDFHDNPSPQSLPTNGDKTGVSSQAISVPQGTGKVQGMGESFSTQLSTGVATYGIPFALPKARGGAQASLALSYNSGGGHGVAGVGWDVGWPYVARQTDRGLPTYDDRAKWHAQQDRFVFNGGQELVPICVVAIGGTCAGVSDEVMPVWAEGWQYFRPRVEGAYLRFFWSPDHKTWRVQDKSGVSMELGQPLDGSLYTGALESDPDDDTRIFRWNVVRQYDSHGSPLPAESANPAPVNAVVYRYDSQDGMAYLTDIYDTPPSASASSAPLTAYAHHTRLVYEVRPDATFSFRRGWRVDQTRRLKRVDITSKTFLTGGAARHLVRRYRLDYDSVSHVSLLTSAKLEGRCSGSESDAPTEGTEGAVPDSTGCASLPAMTFEYQHVAPFKTDGTTGTADLTGYEGFDERVVGMTNSPNYSLDDSQTDLFDINSDSLPDVLVTSPGSFQKKHGVFFNGAGGTAGSFTGSTMGVNGVLGATAGTITLSNLNVAAHDLDGDGTIDLLHMPKVKTYSVYTPQGSGLNWDWQGRTISTANNLNAQIDFGNDNPDLRVVDVNGDGLVDVVQTTGTSLKTFFSLGRYPGGDGQYGSATWTSATTAAISNDAVMKCVPHSGTPVRFSDGDIRIADMNGDGLPDLVRLYKGDIKYWPGRGDGVWGTGDVATCLSGTFGANRHIAMTDSPAYSDSSGKSLRLDDVNGDGLDDLVQIRFSDVDVWLNVDGKGWTVRHVVAGTPPTASITNKVRLVDMDGSGTRDILWGSSGDYKYIDLLGGKQPWVLTKVSNGLGKTTELEYGTTSEMMLAAEAAGSAWSSKAPMPIRVVTKVTDRDNLGVVGRPSGAYVTEYTYRDPVYDGRQREFRGFRVARARRIGDTNSPTSVSESRFLTGDCEDDEPPPAGTTSRCGVDGRWAENPREALKGLPTVTEAFDESGKYLSTTHNTYRLRQLYLGLDGREVRVAFVSDTDTYLYDTASFTPADTSVDLDAVQVEIGSQVTREGTKCTKGDAWCPKVRASTGTVHTRSSTVVDRFGNVKQQTHQGCVSGCAAADEIIDSYTEPGRRADDASGWMWRTVESYVKGSDSVKRKHTFTAYNTAGDPSETTADLAGTLALDRFHEDSMKSVAPAPPGASVDGTITVATFQYDTFGNLVSQRGANHRCRDVAPDTEYAELPISETIYVGTATTGCGDTALTTFAGYDRGLAAPVSVKDLHDELTTVSYDGFGRLVALRKPDPDVVGKVSEQDSVRIEYFLPSDPKTTPYTIVHTQTQDGATAADASYHDAWAFADGMGRAIATLDEADPTAGDGGQWVVNGLTEYNAKGAPYKAYLAWFWNGDPTAFALSTVPVTHFTRQVFDAFDRNVESYALDGVLALKSVYHALSVDKWDAEDLSVSGPHAGTYASSRQDGHGRTAAITERIHAGASIEAREIQTQYLPTGEPAVITRVRVGASDTPVVRWMKYDTLGRMVLNVEPNTTKSFNADPATAPSAVKAWRYAYNDSGDLVGTSDARGCGANYHYDAGGRILVEDYSPCLNSHALYSSPNPSTGDGTEVFYRYDTADPSAPTTIDDCSISTTLLRGRLVSLTDRGAKTLTSFDGRGRTKCVARQVAKPGAPSNALASRFAPRWYTQTVTYDGADRPVDASTGAQVPELLGAANKSVVTTTYTARGTVKAVGGSYGTLVSSITRDADGPITNLTYGDAAETATTFGYDDRRRLSTVDTNRVKPSIWTQTPAPYSPAPVPADVTTESGTFQIVLEAGQFTYDGVDNPTQIDDLRSAASWPSGAKPVSRSIQYDDLYRVKKVDYQFSGPADSWVSPFASENGAGSDPRRAKPSPHLSFGNRVLSQSLQYDWLGNTSSTDDDAKGFYDRSLGTITNGTASAGPYQLKAASGGAAPRDGSLTAKYDDAGYMVGLSVVHNAAAPCLPGGASCSQRFAYDWDEVGRLARARRWDGASLGTASDPLPTGTPAAELKYAYDGTDDRVLKTAVTGATEVHTAYVFDSLELRRAAWNGTDYDRTAWTEVPYLFAHGVRLARVHYATTSVPTYTSGRRHVLFDLPDHLGSSSIVIDKDTGELVERSTYQAYGGADSDYRPDRWEAFREDYRFTGKEEDVEVGLQYFGKRYYAPLLGRWLSPDPMTIHQFGTDPNAYAYVYGRAFIAVDPNGLWPTLADVGQTIVRLSGVEHAMDIGRIAAEKGVGAAAKAHLDYVVYTGSMAVVTLMGPVNTANAPTSENAPRQNAVTDKEALKDIAINVVVAESGGVVLRGASKVLTRTESNIVASERRIVSGGSKGSTNLSKEVRQTTPNPPRAGAAPAPKATTPSTAAVADGAEVSAGTPPPTGPTEAYSRPKHYGRTPTQADRKALGAGPDEVVDHDPPLVQRYYEGDPARGEKPGYQMTPEERKASGSDRSRMRLQPRSESNAQGAAMKNYSQQQKKNHGL